MPPSKTCWVKRKAKIARWGRGWKVPFDREGNQLHWATNLNYDAETGKLTKTYRSTMRWRKGYDFDAVMQITGCYKFRQSAYFILQDVETKKTYSMFFKQFAKMVGEKTITKGVIEPTKWSFMKRGDYYGIIPFIPKPKLPRKQTKRIYTTKPIIPINPPQDVSDC